MGNYQINGDRKISIIKLVFLGIFITTPSIAFSEKSEQNTVKIYSIAAPTALDMAGFVSNDTLGTICVNDAPDQCKLKQYSLLFNFDGNTYNYDETIPRFQFENGSYVQYETGIRLDLPISQNGDEAITDDDNHHIILGKFLLGEYKLNLTNIVDDETGTGFFTFNVDGDGTMDCEGLTDFSVGNNFTYYHSNTYLAPSEDSTLVNKAPSAQQLETCDEWDNTELNLLCICR